MTDEQDERFALRLREWAADYQTPPATPRQAMWEAIARRRAVRRARRRPAVWVGWGVGIAAALALGIALGRVTAPDAAPVPVQATRMLPNTAMSNVAYEITTREHLRQVETFLDVFRSEARAGRLDGAFGNAARLLNMKNRMLLNSPAADDATVRQLLNDVELVLLQIQQFDASGNGEDLEFINDGIQQRSVLMKLRALATQGAT